MVFDGEFGSVIKYVNVNENCWVYLLSLLAIDLWRAAEEFKPMVLLRILRFFMTYISSFQVM